MHTQDSPREPLFTPTPWDRAVRELIDGARVIDASLTVLSLDRRA
jgi:hypothetical protein